jgi:hypothetical protein
VKAFGREAILQFGQEGQEGRSFRDLRVAFKIVFSKKPKPPNSVISIYGLSQTSIALLQGPRALVRLLVGYQAPRLLFQGNPILGGVKVEHPGTDRVITVEGQDGGRAYQEGVVSVSWSTPTTLSQVLSEVQDQLGLPSGTILVPPDVRYPHGITLFGTAREVLDHIAALAAADWWIADGTLNLVAKGQATSQTALLFSADNGTLIGSASRVSTNAHASGPTAPKNGVEITTLIDPAMRPGRVFEVQSETMSGRFVATDVVFTGDTHGPQWYATIQGAPA